MKRISILLVALACGLTACGGSSAKNASSNSNAGGVGPFVADANNPQSPNNRDSHWHAALGVYDCDHWLGDLGNGTWSWPTQSPQQSRGRAGNPSTYAGLHSHEDGLIHMEPATPDDAGANATLGRYFSEGGWSIASDRFTFVGVTRHNGDACNGKPGTVQWWVNGKQQTGDPAAYKLFNDDVVVVAFTASPGVYPGNPPSIKNLPDKQAGDGSASSPTAAPTRDATGKPCVAVTDTYPAGAPQVPVVTGPAPKTLVVKDLKAGTGAVVPKGATVTVNYIGVACSTGKIFDSSYARNEPATFPLDQVIPGWTNGIPGMKVGGMRLLGIPPADGYGAQGQPAAGIAGNETLWFVVEVTAVTP